MPGMCPAHRLRRRERAKKHIFWLSVPHKSVIDRFMKISPREVRKTFHNPKLGCPAKTRPERQTRMPGSLHIIPVGTAGADFYLNPAIRSLPYGYNI